MTPHPDHSPAARQAFRTHQEPLSSELLSLGHVHFLGVGGVGVSGIARILQDQGVPVSGTDAKDLPVMHRLAEGGATMFVGYDAAHLDAAGDVATVVASSIAGPGNPEYDEAVRRGITVLHRSQGLAAAMAGHRVLAVAGTHGKTTTSSMAAMAFTLAGADPTFAVGADVAGLGTNAAAGSGEWFIAEADESDGTLLNYRPEVAIVTNVEADHLDFYGSEDAVHQVFRDFALLLPPDGTVVVCVDGPGGQGLADWIRTRREDGHPAPRLVTYGTQELAPQADLVLLASDPAVHESGPGQRAQLRWQSGGEVRLDLAVPGAHNALNAAAVLAAGRAAGLAEQLIAEGLEAFRGTARRFEHRGGAGGVRVFDDYAHHPTEVSAAVAAGRSVAQGHRVLVLFQPHLFSRTRDFAEGFAQALSAADVVRVLPIYPAREQPIPGVDSSLIAERLEPSLDGSGRVAEDADAAVRELVETARPGDVILTMGAGDVTDQGPVLVCQLKRRFSEGSR